MDIEIIFKDNAGIGYAEIWDNGDVYTGIMFQDRLSDELLEADQAEEAFELLSNTSKAYCADDEDLLKVINKCLDFWFIPSIVEGGSWYKDRLVWAGDYMDKGLFIDEKDTCLYEYVQKHGEEIKPQPSIVKYPRYIINHAKKEYVDKDGCPNTEGWIIHPLSLLTSSGNGRGGGDFRKANDYVGSWAGDSISIEDSIPTGYKLITPNFKE